MKGIYGFKNKQTGMWYIGQSINTEARFGQHIQDTLARLQQDKEQVKFHKALADYPFDNNNWEYHVFENDVNATPEQLDLWEAQYIDTYDCYRNGYNSTKGNHADLINKIQKSSMHMVPQSLCHYMWNHFGLRNLANKIVLLIGQFKLADNLVMNDNTVTVICDNIAYSEAGAKLIRVNGKGELMAEIKKLKGKHFDLIIANPPYEIGNQVTSAVIENIDFDTYINLMPVSKYKGKELYKKVSSIESAEDLFEDAAVGDSLTLATLKKNANVFESYDELMLVRANPIYQNFYKTNKKVRCPFDYRHALKRPAVDELVVENSFLITMRTILDGTHCTENCADYPYNIKNCADNIPWDITHDCASCNFLILNSAIEKVNLSRFWYNNPLMNALIKGLNASSGRMTIAIPNIDWSKERDYEHLTLDDIMNILREENPDVA